MVAKGGIKKDGTYAPTTTRVHENEQQQRAKSEIWKQIAKASKHAKGGKARTLSTQTHEVSK